MRLSAVISSTSIDLPEHRAKVVDACLREGYLPIGMEQLPARDASGVRVSLEMVDRADVYIGIYAWRYGWIPDGSDVSITERELDRALERREQGRLKDILIFLMDEAHPLPSVTAVEADAVAQQKLARLKERASAGRVRLVFKSAEELRTLVVQSLADLSRRLEAADDARPVPSFHPDATIPSAPEPYIAHPYSLLQTGALVGRQQELNELTDWVTTNRVVPAGTSLVAVVAIGGMGKSALTWKWFNDIAPKELPHLAGRMWWSFYESDAHFDNFMIRALAYTAGISEAAARAYDVATREEALLRQLETRPFLIVLDGFERQMLAYSGLNAAHQADDDLDEQTANAIAEAQGLPSNVKETYLERHRLRQCTDPPVGRFMRRLARVGASRILVSTRLYPAELQTETAHPRPGCHPLFITGLKDDDALNLWRALGVTGTSEQLLPLFKTFENYPLLLRALAGEVASYRPAPGDFDRWRTDHPNFDPANLPLKTAKTHVLEFALQGLGERAKRVLHTIAAFRMPATWDTLKALFVGSDKLCVYESDLDIELSELEDRGLVGWDRRSNRYDLHPIVRAVVWQALDGAYRLGIFEELHRYFSAVPPTASDKVSTIEDLTPSIELFSVLVSLGRCSEAIEVLTDRLMFSSTMRLGANRVYLKWIEFLRAALSGQLSAPEDRWLLMMEIMSAANAGEPRRAAGHVARFLDEGEETGARVRSARITGARLIAALSRGIFLTGAMREAESIGLGFLALARRHRGDDDALGLEALTLITFALCGAARAEWRVATLARDRALRMYPRLPEDRAALDWLLSDLQRQLSIWSRDAAPLTTPIPATVSEEVLLATVYTRVTRQFGEMNLARGNEADAETLLRESLKRARESTILEEELPTLNALAELHRRRGELETARELLEQIWIPAERGPYKFSHADGLNTLARVERDTGNRGAAVAAATAAFKQAWCDGPPYAYEPGLRDAREMLAELDAPEPVLPPFDASTFDPLPDVELNPQDEFYVDPSELTDET